MDYRGKNNGLKKDTMSTSVIIFIDIDRSKFKTAKDKEFSISTYRSIEEINEKICPRLNALKKKSTDAFRPFISHSTKSLSHSMGNPLKAAEDVVEYKDKDWIINSLLKIVTLLSYRFALGSVACCVIRRMSIPRNILNCFRQG